MERRSYHQYLVERYKDNRATPDEIVVFFLLLEQGSLDQELLDSMEMEYTAYPIQHIPRRPKAYVWAAAAAILTMAVSAYLLFQPAASPKPTAPVTTTLPATKIGPGRNGAILTLANDRQVVLDSLGNGLIAVQQGTQVTLKNGRLAYTASHKNSGAIVYNTISTPNGRQFRMTLPDGTQVWLNAASSLHYPTRFTGKERQVEVTGEAYFEVAQKEQIPFHIRINGRMEVLVLGTNFNIKAYTDEPDIKTTLLEGKIKVLSYGSAQTLHPGQQALALSQSPVKVLDHVNMEKVMAWKNGEFNFQDENIQQVMRQIGRWYDLRIIYEKDLPALQFWGDMYRDVPLSDVLKFLETYGLKFRLEENGKTLAVTK